MPVHDWTLVEAGIFHAFHTGWVFALQSVLNEGLLPEGYYALAEQHFGRSIADVLTLHASPEPRTLPSSLPPDSGGITVAELPPRTRRHDTITPATLARRRSLALRHVSGHRLIALLEIVSPANKDRADSVEEFIVKAVNALEVGVHLLVVDLFPPGPHDPEGIHGAILQHLGGTSIPYAVSEESPLTLASYPCGPQLEIDTEHLAVGALLPEMPLFLRPDRYVKVSLEPTYEAALRGMPTFWRHTLQERPADK